MRAGLDLQQSRRPLRWRIDFRSSCPGVSRASTFWPRKTTWMAGTRPAMTVDGRERSFRGLRHIGVARQIHHLQLGADALRGAVLEADHGVDGDVAGPA